jgi:enamine deaminase RidA (YjgF/YER057c/UK114 family)
MAKYFNPAGVAPPQAEYHHGVLIPENTELLYTSGQLGIKPDGTLADGIEEQARWAFRNLVAVLEDAGMGPENLVKIQLFLKEQKYLQIVEAARNEALGSAEPASTLMVVKSLALPEFLFEVEGIAARSG